MKEIKNRTEILATIDELNQYLLGNVTLEAATESVQDLTNDLRYELRW